MSREQDQRRLQEIREREARARAEQQRFVEERNAAHHAHEQNLWREEIARRAREDERRRTETRKDRSKESRITRRLREGKRR
jgi:hypothetical protein